MGGASLSPCYITTLSLNIPYRHITQEKKGKNKSKRKQKTHIVLVLPATQSLYLFPSLTAFTFMEDQMGENWYRWREVLDLTPLCFADQRAGGGEADRVVLCVMGKARRHARCPNMLGWSWDLGWKAFWRERGSPVSALYSVQIRYFAVTEKGEAGFVWTERKLLSLLSLFLLSLSMSAALSCSTPRISSHFHALKLSLSLSL